ncbi:olfactory receptor 4K5-like [Latimeria chalumnae]|uniref:olfactory receptor 4K5-like n=1 Tax=Latimeria chalumnae TaxID=7897 RepID=UPI00313D025A
MMPLSLAVLRHKPRMFTRLMSCTSARCDNNSFHWTVSRRLIKQMENDSYSAMFTLTAFGEMDNLKYLYGCCALLSYLTIIFINLTLFVVIVHEESLHEPMYIFIGNLAINGLYGTTAFFPKLIADLMSEKQTISHFGCAAQLFFIHTFAAFEFYTLALMAFDRYVAICNPLSVRASKEARGKAIQTCAPHLLTFLNYIVAVTFEISQRLFDTTKPGSQSLRACKNVGASLGSAEN